MNPDYRREYLQELRRLKILVACGYDRRQAVSVERLLKQRGAW